MRRTPRILPWALSTALILALGFAACSKTKESASKDPSPQSPKASWQDSTIAAVQPSPTTQAPPPEVNTQKPAEPERQEARKERPRETGGASDRDVNRRETPSQPVIREFTVAAGSAIPVILDQELTTKTDAKGAQFTTKIKEAVVVDGVPVLPAQTTIRGVVMRSDRAPRLGGKAEMVVEFTGVELPNGESYAIQSEPIMFEGSSSTKGDVGKVIGGAVGGGVLGGVLGGKKGALKGAAAGGVAGGVWAAATRGSDLYVTQGTEISVTLRQGVQIPVKTGGRS
jgi:hypothetical protein